MSYRDDLEAAQARIDALEQEKAELVEEAKQARERSARLHEKLQRCPDYPDRLGRCPGYAGDQKARKWKGFRRDGVIAMILLLLTWPIAFMWLWHIKRWIASFGIALWAILGGLTAFVFVPNGWTGLNVLAGVVGGGYIAAVCFVWFIQARPGSHGGPSKGWENCRGFKMRFPLIAPPKNADSR
jgi:hypothetical protein